MMRNSFSNYSPLCKIGVVLNYSQLINWFLRNPDVHLRGKHGLRHIPGLRLLHTLIGDCINIFMSVLLVYQASSGLGDLLFHLCCVQSRAPRAMQMRSLFSNTFPLSGFWQTAACLPGRLESWALLQAWVVITVVLSAFSPQRLLCLALEWSRPVSVSPILGLWLGTAQQARLS